MKHFLEVIAALLVERIQVCPGEGLCNFTTSLGDTIYCMKGGFPLPSSFLLWYTRKKPNSPVCNSTRFRIGCTQILQRHLMARTSEHYLWVKAIAWLPLRYSPVCAKCSTCLALSVDKVAQISQEIFGT